MRTDGYDILNNAPCMIRCTDTQSSKNNRPLAVSSKTSDKMLIPSKKYLNSNNTIRVVVTKIFTANLHMFSPEIPSEQSLARVILLAANNEEKIAVKLYSAGRVNS